MVNPKSNKLCIVKSCNNKHHSKNLCKRHYNLFRYHNDKEYNLRHFQRAKPYTLRLELLEIIGKSCACCSKTCYHGNDKCVINDLRIIQIDHKFGSGNKEQREFGGNYAMYKFYINNPEIAKQKLQPLCANCNWMKRHNLSEHAYSERHKLKK